MEIAHRDAVPDADQRGRGAHVYLADMASVESCRKEVRETHRPKGLQDVGATRSVNRRREESAPGVLAGDSSVVQSSTCKNDVGNQTREKLHAEEALPARGSTCQRQ